MSTLVEDDGDDESPHPRLEVDSERLEVETGNPAELRQGGQRRQVRDH